VQATSSTTNLLRSFSSFSRESFSDLVASRGLSTGLPLTEIILPSLMVLTVPSFKTSLPLFLSTTSKTAWSVSSGAGATGVAGSTGPDSTGASPPSVEEPSEGAGVLGSVVAAAGPAGPAGPASAFYSSFFSFLASAPLNFMSAEMNLVVE